MPELSAIGQSIDVGMCHQHFDPFFFALATAQR
jgi:hypothetical protein